MEQKVTDKQPSRDFIEVRKLKKYFPVRGGLLQKVVNWVQAVDDVSFAIRKGETLGLVGESGCGKTTIGRTILRLIEPTEGLVFYKGQEIVDLSQSELKAMRRNMQIIFQDPYASLDPRKQIGDTVIRGLNIHKIGSRHERQEMMVDALEHVGLRDYHARRFPHEFSGGQRQRVGIARALILRPEFIVCDEPVSALDVSIQSQVLNLLKDLREELGLTFLFISHDLSVVEHISHRVTVMYLGKLVELASRERLFNEPLHPYTKALISAIPVANPRIRKESIILTGDVPSPLNPPSGCRFHPRCPVVTDICSQEEPEFKEVSPDHWVACWLVD
jgi:peptide/nickel transport system ATP-binding protein/oligopeptide transport system ATP-binding protein